ncbi:hypothetical protein TVAG_016840 [Trichomonas vaginalis G3]|uniref:Peptidase C1A papain C-terminal domain-containing protein n=1 Tax=Trichomonas vaginalis (strain ATCC PRA-98 / G3) TaxID=412133 RepID=A2ER22_TRIV3|nr:cysteine proteinases family [Trichomonas vaginalis G3]EAY04912.1 hypothetical protein TVAG_016840 [Trichomonas vaginalis G3]KAI5519430.1 cysteine proteinases family [Trichomonas vaginalis G3]|eukprot:XP_001317135.1 hypothetical protein [Trichomonas vaginalis G3]
MSISVSRWAGQFVNFSLQYVLDCDILGDSCVERTPLNAYQLFWTYHPPDYKSWDKPGDSDSERTNFMQAPRADFKRENCENNRCYPGLTNCKHHWALTGSCNPGDPETGCPIYFLYNWRWIKSHLWEVGAVTSSITVYPSLFSYEGGIYSSYWDEDGKTRNDWDKIIGMLDVTIIGWGQNDLNLNKNHADNVIPLQRWWWVIPHFGADWGTIYGGSNDVELESLIITGTGIFKTEGDKLITELNQSEVGKGGFMRFNRRFDDCNIESQAVGAVPYNFVPLPHRTPAPTEFQEN